jgi:hypothetical protein
MPFARRSPSRIALDLFERLEEKDNEASKWDLLKVVGTESQFHFWVEEFLIGDKFVFSNEAGNRLVYGKTENGELLHELLKNGRIMKALVRISGKRVKKGKVADLI